MMVETYASFGSDCISLESGKYHGRGPMNIETEIIMRHGGL